MRTSILSLVLTALCAGCATSHSAEAPARAEASGKPVAGLGPREMLKLMDASPRHYQIGPLSPAPSSDAELEALAQALWPRVGPEFEFPMVTSNPSGQTTVAAYPANAEANALIASGEDAYQFKEFEEADKAYAKALDKVPGYYPALLEHGNAAFFGKNLQVALERFEQAIQSDPGDHRGYFYKADALLALGKVPEALDAFAWALTVKPRAKVLRQALQQKRALLGRRLEGDLFLPPVKVEQTGPDTITESVAMQPHWLAFANCRAVWLGEPDHARALLGRPRADFSTTEELECLMNALVVYRSSRASGEVPADPRMEKVSAIVAAGQAAELVIFELGSRRSPHLTLELPEAERRKLHDFVLRWILVPEPGAPTSGK